MRIMVPPRVGLVVLAIVLGIIAWLHGMVITSFRETSLALHLVIVIPDSLLFGLIIGSIRPERWLLAGVTGWLNAILGIFVLVDIMETGQVAAVDVRDLLGLSLLPLGLAFLGGYIGTILVNKLGRKRTLTGAILLAAVAIVISSLCLL